ncbi:hypothetical protein AAU01_39210 [Paenarthrobacter aurescens]|uniref:Uncharacterized protein n=1 Tax=Paenarthrobacter aurescens TaxID=43663 RepID=A0A4Y3NPP4_PAEAU|nr:hypothetical protein AAU01_39210 [Paenarthrobacter aurescens]
MGYHSGMDEAAGTPGNDASAASSWEVMVLLSVAVVITLDGGTDKIDT